MVEMFSKLSHVHNQINNEVSWLFIIQLSRTISVSNCKRRKIYNMVFITCDIFHCFSQFSELTESCYRGHRSKIPRNTPSVFSHFQFSCGTYES